MIEMRLSDSSQISRLKQIWKSCFGDSDQYINFFYNNCYKPDETAILLENGQIATMLILLPMTIVVPDGRNLLTRYLYAFATDPVFRRRGFGGQLIDFADKHVARLENDSVITVPANEKMFGYFGSKGYAKAFFIREGKFSRQQIVSGSLAGKITPATAAEYNALRNKLLTGRMYVKYDDYAMDYQKKLAVESGADCYIINIRGITGCATVESYPTGTVLIKEMLLPDEQLPAGLALIGDILPAGTYVVRTPAFLGARLGGEVRPYGMVSWCRDVLDVETSNRFGYMAFAYD
ncbi:MAG: hypothetical protein H6Q74_782 [Firmicutes bacterium]|nr:hypothetical protein [Bacillota bacterium]